jgi:hypothetical protein
MEHIVQFGISIDDDVIKKNVEKNVMQQVTNMVKQDCMKELVGKKECSQWEYSSRISYLVEDTAYKFLDSYKSEIVDLAASKLAERLSKTKAVKDMVASTLDELLK